MSLQLVQPDLVVQHQKTWLGAVVVEGPVSPACLAGLTMNKFLTNFRPSEQQKAALVEIAGLEDPGLVFIARHAAEIVGYVTFLRPDPYTRWLAHPRILELGAVEVSRQWRRCNMASELLASAFSYAVLEDTS
ncbi:MAG TPA: GNAT family N-acetyltransferase [Spirochaetia bacterium]|nr:GNAT family N-acetyltransferase [Spirochaetia bacterium]